MKNQNFQFKTTTTVNETIWGSSTGSGCETVLFDGSTAVMSLTKKTINSNYFGNLSLFKFSKS